MVATAVKRVDAGAFLVDAADQITVKIVREIVRVRPMLFIEVPKLLYQRLRCGIFAPLVLHFLRQRGWNPHSRPLVNVGGLRDTFLQSGCAVRGERCGSAEHQVLMKVAVAIPYFTAGSRA